MANRVVRTKRIAEIIGMLKDSTYGEICQQMSEKWNISIRQVSRLIAYAYEVAATNLIENAVDGLKVHIAERMKTYGLLQSQLYRVMDIDAEDSIEITKSEEKGIKGNKSTNSKKTSTPTVMGIEKERASIIVALTTQMQSILKDVAKLEGHYIQKVDITSKDSKITPKFKINIKKEGTTVKELGGDEK